MAWLAVPKITFYFCAFLQKFVSFFYCMFFPPHNILKTECNNYNMAKIITIIFYLFVSIVHFSATAHCIADLQLCEKFLVIKSIWIFCSPQIKHQLTTLPSILKNVVHILLHHTTRVLELELFLI